MRTLRIFFLSIFVILASVSMAWAAADFSINTFSCTPAEVVINDVFSCTAQIKNVGDAAGSVNEVRLYPDSNNWLEQSNYLQNSGSSVSPGQTTEVTFSGMRATKSGNNGFSRITLDNQADTWVADNNVKENIIDASVKVTNSFSSRASGETFTVTPEVTAGGNIDATLTFVVNSGGCSIGSQSATKSTTGLLDQQKWTPSAWTVTEGSSGDCKYTITASATGANGIATTTAPVSSTITCTSSDCATSSGSSSGSSGGGGGGGGGSPTLGELKTSVSYELSADGAVRFSFGGTNHTFSVLSLSDTVATVTIKSEPQTLTFTVGDEKSVDLEGDGKMDVSIKLKSINIITKKATFIFTPLYVPSSITGKATDTPKAGAETTPAGSSSGNHETSAGTTSASSSSVQLWPLAKILGILIVLALIALAAYHFWSNSQHRRLMRAVRLKHFTPERLSVGKK